MVGVTDALTRMMDGARSGGSTPAPAPWAGPVPLEGTADLPAFPSGVLPGWLQGWAEAEAVALQVPVDLPAMLSLAACSAAVSGKVEVRVRPGWAEPTNLLTVTALPPGERKSAAFADATRPMEDFEAAEARRMAPEIAEAASRYRMAEAALQKAEAAGASAKEEERGSRTAEAAALARDLAGMTVPAVPRLIADDCTPEALASLLAEQGGRMSVMSPEGDTFDLMAGRYSSGTPNLGVYLKGHAGDALRVNRRGRAEYVQAPALTVGLAVQPDVLRGLQQKPGFRGRGLLGRFLYALPPSMVGHRETRPKPMSPAVRSTYERSILALLALPAGTDADGHPTPHVLRLDPAAEAEIDAFGAWLEPQMAPGAALSNITDWAGKLAGAVVRIAGIFHMAKQASTKEPWSAPVDADTMRAAVRLAEEYLIPHAQAAYGVMGAQPEIEGARRILRWLRDTATGTFTKRDAFNGLRGGFERATDLDEPLRVLEERGYIRPIPAPEAGRPGRPPSPAFEVNPATHITHITQNGTLRPANGNSAECAYSAEDPQAPEEVGL